MIQYWDNGNKKAASNWRDKRCEDEAKRWIYEGKLISDIQFARRKKK